MSGIVDLPADQDSRIRVAAFEHVRRLAKLESPISAASLSKGFDFQGDHICLLSKALGIFKPRQMATVLSIRTGVPRPGRKIWYEDQVNVHRQIYEPDETVEYALERGDPNKGNNLRLRVAWEQQFPVIYFLGVAPALYHALMPTYIVDWNPVLRRVGLGFGLPDQPKLSAPPSANERRYVLRTVKQRLHQATFREMVIAAYGGRCALSGLREQRLLDAAHIVSDTDELLGQPVVVNGLPMSKLHHAAFDADLIGIDPDFRVHVSECLRHQHDGPMLEAMKQLQDRRLHLPADPGSHPDRDRLAERYERFRTSA
ncbi:MAG: HNH endonuclease [Rhodobacteraceae bacterium]|nr:HNH endonuclease [Paracoccaceae bacterium]MCY4327727.1 HNH endonuclease [Paracoccaceae bacterium]